MSEKNNDRFNLDFYSLFTDYLKNLYVIILGALIGSILEVTGAALKLADIMALKGYPALIGHNAGPERCTVGTPGMSENSDGHINS